MRQQENNLYYWKLRKTLTITEAAHLIIGENPSGHQDSTDYFGLYTSNFDPVFHTLHEALSTGELIGEGLITLDNETGSPVSDQTKIAVPEIKKWLTKNEVRSDFFETHCPTESIEEKIQKTANQLIERESAATTKLVVENNKLKNKLSKLQKGNTYPELREEITQLKEKTTFLSSEIYRLEQEKARLEKLTSNNKTETVSLNKQPPASHPCKDKTREDFAPELALALELWEELYLNGNKPQYLSHTAAATRWLDHQNIAQKRQKERLSAATNPAINKNDQKEK